VTEQQLDLFSDASVRVEQPLRYSTGHPVVAADMDDAALIAAIPDSNLADSLWLAAEAGSPQPFRPLPRFAGVSPASGAAAWCLNKPPRFARLP
jgi:hypothetical protein